MKNTVVFIVFVLVVLGLLWSISGSKAPRIPENDAHREFTVATHCLDCHKPGAQAPRKPTHPPKDQCLECHKVKKNRKPT